MKRPSFSRMLLLSLMTAVLILNFWGCASMMRHMQSTTHYEFDRTPYFRGLAKHLPSSTDVVKMFPITLDARKDWFAPSLKPLAKTMNRYWTSKGWIEMIDPIPVPKKGAPNFEFGDAKELLALDENDGDYNANLMLIVTQPSQVWQEKWRANLPHGVKYTILAKVGISAYHVRQKNWKGSKEIQIGTGYHVDVPWLTSLDDPVPVVQIAGALLDENGKIVRAGAEGIFVKKVDFWKSVIGWGEMISEKDVEKIIHKHRRNDLPGKPLAWQVAVQNLVANLLEQNERVIK